jgi:hypothetical protein
MHLVHQKSLQDDHFPTNPHTLSILASFWKKWQGKKVNHASVVA